MRKYDIEISSFSISRTVSVSINQRAKSAERGIMRLSLGETKLLYKNAGVMKSMVSQC